MSLISAISELVDKGCTIEFRPTGTVSEVDLKVSRKGDPSSYTYRMHNVGTKGTAGSALCIYNMALMAQALGVKLGPH